jgi:hypothetical protein
VMASIDGPTVLRLRGWIPDSPTIVADFASRGPLDDLIMSNQKVPGWDETRSTLPGIIQFEDGPGDANSRFWVGRTSTARQTSTTISKKTITSISTRKP